MLRSLVGSEMCIRDSFNTYVALGVCVSSFLALPFLQWNDTFVDKSSAGTSFEFEPLGLLAGGLIAISMTFSFLAIQAIGLSVAQGVWGGVALLTSFFGGLVVGQSSIKSALIVLALSMLLLGVVGIALCQELTSRVWLPCFPDSEADKALPLGFRRLGKEQLVEPSPPPNPNPNLPVEDPDMLLADSAEGGQQLVGVLFAVLTGLAGGSVLIPMQYVADARSGLVFVPSLGIGAGITGLAIGTIHLGYHQQFGDLGGALKFRSCLLPGLLAGTIWDISNTACIYAIPRLGFSVANPMMQCALLVSSCWGVFVFKEITLAKTIAILFISGIVLLGGAAVLSVSVSTK
eukprot:TRINITY_DN11679_c0_g1_i1.p1 TRINITY_DN11679_c0_g1~~TRINITY_DN11679_c0_g1_i1.p1  ORF type:complete len:362 (+),score=107.65 TRINITY_DN11679_c0_g1_i1:46-1086(+)